MTSATIPLKQYEDEVSQWKSTVDSLAAEVSSLKEQVEWFRRQIFGKKSERIARDLNNAQMQFEGFDVPQVSNKEKTQTVPAHERRKPRRDGQDAITIPDDLPVKTVVLDIPDDEKVRKETGTPLVHIGNETTHKLAQELGSYYIKEIIRPKYARPQRPEDGILTAELPDSIIPKCRADDSLLADYARKGCLGAFSRGAFKDPAGKRSSNYRRVDPEN